MKASKFFGRAEGVHFEAGRRWHTGDGDLPACSDQPGNIFQLEKVCRSATDRDEASEAAGGRERPVEKAGGGPVRRQPSAPLRASRIERLPGISSTTAPKFGSIAAARVPQFIQQRQIDLNPALPNPGDIGSLAAASRICVWNAIWLRCRWRCIPVISRLSPCGNEMHKACKLPQAELSSSCLSRASYVTRILKCGQKRVILLP